MTFSPGVISCEATYQSRPHSNYLPGVISFESIRYAIDKIKNRNVDQPESCPARTGANAGLGAATAATWESQRKPRTGLAGGGPSGSGTSVAGTANHNLARAGAYGPKTRNVITKCLRKFPYVGLGLGAFQLGGAVFNPAESNELRRIIGVL